MKKATLILAVLCCCLACKHTISDNGCISRITGPLYPSYLKTGQLDTIKSLFSANNLSTANLDFYNYLSYPSSDAGVSFYVQYVNATLTLKGLPIFNSYAIWEFRNGIYNPNYNYTNPAPVSAEDTVGRQSLPALRAAFFRLFEKALYTSGSSLHPKRPGSYYHDSCLTAQLGYIDAATQPGSNLAYNTKWIKVWKVSTSATSIIGLYGQPSAGVYVIDSTGDGWCFSVYFPGEVIITPYTI